MGYVLRMSGEMHDWLTGSRDEDRDAAAERLREIEQEIEREALAELRARLGLTETEVAGRMGVWPQRVAAIERAEPGATEVRTLAGYVEALGGRLEIIADAGGERVVLR